MKALALLVLFLLAPATGAETNWVQLFNPNDDAALANWDKWLGPKKSGCLSLSAR